MPQIYNDSMLMLDEFKAPNRCQACSTIAIGNQINNYVSTLKRQLNFGFPSWVEHDLLVGPLQGKACQEEGRGNRWLKSGGEGVTKGEQ